MPKLLVKLLLISLNTKLLRAEGARNLNAILGAMTHLLFSDCDVFSVTDSSNSFDSERAFIDLNALPWDLTSRDGSSSKRRTIFQAGQAKVYTSGTFLINLATAQREFEIPIINTYHRYALQCSFVILALENVTRMSAHAQGEKLLKILTRDFGPVTHRDEDYYVILSATELQRDLLQMEFWRELKCKIWLSRDEHRRDGDEHFKALASCFYCDDGRPKLLDMSLSTQTFASSCDHQRYGREGWLFL